MTRSTFALLLLLTTLLLTTLLLPMLQASAQHAADGLDATQQRGRQIFAQSCGVCHLPPALNARTYGPALSKDTASGNAEVIRGLINDGTPRMPAFKHYLQRAEVDAIIAYLKTVPTAPATVTR